MPSANSRANVALAGERPQRFGGRAAESDVGDAVGVEDDAVVTTMKNAMAFE